MRSTMDLLKIKLLQELREAREELLNINFATDKLSYTYGGLSEQFSLIHAWREKWDRTFTKLNSPTNGGYFIQIPMRSHLSGYEREEDPEILNELRPIIVRLIDAGIASVDKTYQTAPLLEEYIARVKDTKLAELLKEFNATKDIAPNLAAIGFRTILSLIIQEKAKRVNPASRTATRTDLAPGPMIDSARNERILSSDEQRLIDSFVSTHRDIYDLITHRPGRLIDKGEVDTMIDLLNKFLPAIIN